MKRSSKMPRKRWMMNSKKSNEAVYEDCEYMKTREERS